MHKHTNKLIHETSPYLLQHAHNPVQWYPWGEEALKKAKTENKPILVSIGYAACHWCHVMERESFEDESTAAIMNEHFINIKIDREERPDLDHIYMDAVQAMTGSGGWPLNVFLTPDAKPFYGGTYFPPGRAYNRPSWQEVLYSITRTFTERRHEVNAQAENLTEHLLHSNSFGIQKIPADEIFSSAKADEVFQNIMKSADKEWGGFGRAPKFPQTFTIQFLLRYYYTTGHNEALSQALLSLDKMIEGGIYDQLGGGFARYATDTEWLAPHFEKMLYDNALLVAVLSEAYQLTRNKRYREVIDETMGFISTEMLYEGKAFYAALDADSEGREGKFYVWNVNEIKEVLKDDAAIFCEYYDVSEKGNWEHTNILRVKRTAEVFARERGLDVTDFNERLARFRQQLLAVRNKRTRPQTDDKIILGWNALMNTACSKAYAATGNELYRQLAIDNMKFLLDTFSEGDGVKFVHTWKNNKAKHPAFLDDYAYLIQALIHLQEITADTAWLLKAKELTGYVINHFSETGTGFFYFTAASQTDVIVRKKEVYDGAIPSSNAVMAFNLYQLSILFDIPEWKKRVIDMVSALGNAISRYPTSFGAWACLLLELMDGTFELAVVGERAASLLPELLSRYIPNRVLMVTENTQSHLPLLAGKPQTSHPYLYLCRNYTCQAPVFSVKELISLINRPPARE
jgi:hypothetical protein